MTVPLMILAFFAIFIGMIGIPGAMISHANLFGEFLAPVFPMAHHGGEEEDAAAPVDPEAAELLVLPLCIIGCRVGSEGPGHGGL